MSDSKSGEDAPDSLSNRDTIDVSDDLSLSDSDPEESTELFSAKVEDSSSSSSSSDEEERAQRGKAVRDEKPTFRLSGGSSGFSDRTKSIFDQLDSAAKLTSTHLAEDNVLDGTFARPAPPSPPPPAKVKGERTRKAPTGKKIPDYLSHPERWTRYTLEDVSETSDRTNSQVAHEFIRDLQERRRSKEGIMETFAPAFNQGHSSSSEHKIIFAKPSQTSKDEGQSAQKVERAKKSEVGLIHLDTGRDEEEEGKTASLHQSRTLKDEKEGEEKKRKRVAEDKGDMEEEKAGNVTFHSGKKVNRKHFRKAVGEPDED